MISFALYVIYYFPSILIALSLFFNLKSYKLATTCLICSVITIYILFSIWPDPDDEFGMIFVFILWFIFMVFALFFTYISFIFRMKNNSQNRPYR